MSGLALELQAGKRDSSSHSRSLAPVHTGVVACRLRCWCGALEGIVTNPARASHVVCYCEYCQAYAHLLGLPQRLLDEHGGSHLLQTLPANITFTSSLETLVCLRLTPRGMLRWYARCCGAPIGNTLANPKLSVIRLVHACLDTGGASLEEIFGPVTAWRHTVDATGKPRPKSAGRSRMTRWLFNAMLNARLNGDYRRTPFFNPDTGAPIVTPRQIRRYELDGVMAPVRMR
jgi:hypothetical protein